MGLLDELTAKLEGPARYVFELAVRQAYITGALLLLLAVFMVILSTVLLVLAGRGWRAEAAKTHAYGGPDQFGNGLLALGGILLLTASAGIAAYSFLLLLNPEYRALLE